MENGSKIKLIRGDITMVEADAIVNAANTDLLHGGGLAAAIVTAGGKKIQEESERIGPIPLGEAAVTDAGKLKARYVIHAASMRLGGQTTEQQLTDALVHTYRRAAELNIKSIAIPSIGTGIGGFPLDRAAEIQLDLAKKFLESHPDFQNISFVLNSENAMRAFQTAYNRLFVGHTDEQS